MESPRPPPVLSRLGERLPFPPIRADNQAPGRQSGPWVSDPQPGGPLLSASTLLLVGCVPRSRMRSSRSHSCQRHGAPLPAPPKVAMGAETGRAVANRAADTPGLERTLITSVYGTFPRLQALGYGSQPIFTKPREAGATSRLTVQRGPRLRGVR